MEKKNPAAVSPAGGADSRALVQGAGRQPNTSGAPAPGTISNVGTYCLCVTRFDDAKAKLAHLDVLTLPELRVKILAASAPTKAALPWLKLARFGRRRSPGGSLRHNDNLLAFSGVELDYDGMAISFDAAVAKLRELHCRALIYTSPSHTIAKPRWRLLLPTSREIWQSDLREVLVGRVDGFFGEVFAEESYSLSTSYYFGRAEDNAAADHRCEIIDGDYLDLREDLAMFDLPVPPPIDPELRALLERCAGDGVSTRPEDNPSRAVMTKDDLEIEMRFALSVIPSDDYHLWYRIGAAIYDGLGDAGIDLFDEWSQLCPDKYSPHGTQRKWQDVSRIRSVRVSTIFYHADQCDPNWRDKWQRYLRGEVQL